MNKKKKQKKEINVPTYLFPQSEEYSKEVIDLEKQKKKK
ncbi:unknown [Firmicutes bacterium CAG:449]|nr:unknown [Firmicutes bacterium CAG:449]